MYLSISVDKRTSINDFSVDWYGNDIKNMISTEYDNTGEYNQFVCECLTLIFHLDNQNSALRLSLTT